MLTAALLRRLGREARLLVWIDDLQWCDADSVPFVRELLCAAEGAERRAPLRPGSGTQRALEIIREVVPPLEQDRPPSPDIEAIAYLIESGGLAGI